MENTLTLEVERSIPSPWWIWRTSLRVVDMDPLSDAVLLEQVRDNPFCSRWYLLTLENARLSPLGCGADHGVFLGTDPLGE